MKFRVPRGRRVALVLIVLALALLPSTARAQLPILFYDFEDNASRTTFENAIDLAMNPGATPLVRSGNTTTISGVPGAGFFSAGSAASGAAWQNVAADPGVAATDYYELSFSTSGLTGLDVSWAANASADGPELMGLLYSTDGVNFTAAGPAQMTGNSGNWSVGFASFDLSKDPSVDDQPTVTLRIYACAGANGGFSASGTLAIDNLNVGALGTAPNAGSKTTISESAYFTSYSSGGTGISLLRHFFTVRGPNTTVSLGSTHIFDGAMYVQSGATLAFGATGGVAHSVRGSATFELDATSTIRISDPNGIVLSTTQGNIRTSGKFLDPAATYVYERNGTGGQNTGSALPGVLTGLVVAALGPATTTPLVVTTAGMTFHDVRLVSGGMDFGTTATLNGTLTRAGGAIAAAHPPTYAVGSTLRYESLAAIGDEWRSGVSGVGVPHHVSVGPVAVDFNPAWSAVAHDALGGLTVDAGGSLVFGTTAPFRLAVRGNVALHGGIVANGRALRLDGTANQLLSGPGGGVSLDHLDVFKPTSELDLAVPVTLAGSLALGGIVDPQASTLTFGPAMALAWSSGFVRGGVTRLLPAGSGTYGFPIGDGTQSSGVTTTLNVTTPGALRWTTTPGDHPDVTSSRIDPAQSLNRYWTVSTEPPFAAVPGAFGVGFNASDVDGGADPLRFSVHQWTGAWAPYTSVSRTAATNTWNQTGPLSGDFALGEATWTITATAGANGSIAPLGAVVVADGATPAFTLTPDPGYAVDDVLVDGGSIGAVTNYVFPAVVADHTIHATFRQPRTLTWASSGTSDWGTAANWFDELALAPATSIPTTDDHVVVNDSRGATVGLNVGTVSRACRSLTIGAGFTVRLSGPTGSLVVGDGASGAPDIVVQNGGILSHESTAPSGNPLSLLNNTVDRFRIDDGGHYLHNTPRSFATPFTIAACDFQPSSTVEFGQAVGLAVTLSGRTYGNLRLSATAAKSYTGTVGASNVLNINGELNLSSSLVSLTVALTSSATCNIKHIRVNGGTLSFGTSTMPLAISGDINSSGSIVTSSTQTVTFDGVTEVGTGSPILWTNGFIVAPGRTLALQRSFNWSAGKTADIRGAFVLRAGGAVLKVLKYFAGSSLEYANASGYVVSNEWAAGGPGVGGVPRHVIVSAGPVQMPPAPRTLDGSLDLNAGSFELGGVGEDLEITGDWRENGGTFTTAGGVVSFNGATDAVISGAGGVDIPWLVLDKGVNQVTLATTPATELRIANELTLNGGRVVTGPNVVVLALGANLIRGGAWVDGRMRRTPDVGSSPLIFDVGDATQFAPLILDLTGEDGLGTITVHTVDGDHPDVANSGIDPAQSLDRHWVVENAGAGFTDAQIEVTLDPLDIDGGANPLAFVARKHDGGTWTRPASNTDGAQFLVTGLTSFSEFAIGEAAIHTITASAGANGTIAPAGAVPVADGDAQGFLITPDAGYVVADVEVDAVSVGAVTSYVFPAVGADHTIAASFVFDPTPNRISAISPGGCISTATPCVSVPVTITRTEAIGIRAFSVGVQLSAGLELCTTPGASITEGTFLSGIGATAFQVIAHGGGSYTVDGSILGAPCGATAAAGTLFTVSVRKATGGPEGSGTVTIGTLLLRDCLNVPLEVTAGSAAGITIDTVTPAAIAGLTAQQVKTGNDADGTTGILLAWPAPEAGTTVEVWRAGYGNHPEYDDPPTPGSTPATPSYPPGAPWTLIPASVSETTDEPAARDFWHYVAFVKDACGNVSAASNRTNGTLNYHLGDVTNGVTPGTGDNAVGTVDVSLLGANYGLSGGAMAAVNYLDVGPTTDLSVDARPTTDDELGFEDLILLALNFLTVSAPGTVEDAAAITGGPDRLTLVSDGSAAVGGTIVADLALAGSGRIQGLSARLSWNPRVVEPVGVDAGEFVTGAGGIVLTPGGGVIDAALLGARTVGFAGDGVLARVTFRVIAPGDPGLALAGAVARDARNQPVEVSWSDERVSARPTMTALLPASPNPSAGQTRLGFSLVRGGRVGLVIYSVNGRIVRRLLDEERAAGFHDVLWDGTSDDGRRLAAGVYFAALSTPDGSFRRSLIRTP